ncbi:Gfo/Idh/MocA family oxidoreductase [Actinomyces sp.]|uniref:Gfo/Idh/MocA family protein n=1 Tax=Actinomyces sp. TaxID=29317 RepID=UPI0026DA8369|nr:Gfo/Idh/MocA family oxidoreductase [Actinomyces sp.]MDO4900575.1 Gfo/Idh/MocA family oxidoreductase [Actinomyces sp.]
MTQTTSTGIRCALLGAGRIGRGHAAALAAIDEVALTVADADPYRAREVAQALEPASGVAVKHTVPGEVFARAEEYDAVVIATPTASHEELVLACARVGLPVFCEKPLASDLAGTKRCIDAISRAGIASQIGFQRRFDPAYAEARRRVRAGELGQVHRVHMLTCDQNPPPESFVATSGGIWRDCLIHDIDALRWVTGREVVEVVAFGQVRGADYFRAHGDIDEGVALLRLDDGTMVTAQTSRNNGQGYDVRMEIAGTRANATVGLDRKVPLVSVEPGADFPGPEPWVDFIARFADCYGRELRAFIDVVAGRATSRCEAREALEALRVAIALGISREQGRPVRLEEIQA